MIFCLGMLDECLKRSHLNTQEIRSFCRVSVHYYLPNPAKEVYILGAKGLCQATFQSHRQMFNPGNVCMYNPYVVRRVLHEVVNY